MKRLLLTFGLVIAFFVSSVNASIYDLAASLPPNTSSVNVYTCAQISYGGLQTPLFETVDISSCLQNGQDGYRDAYDSPVESGTCVDRGDALTVISRSCKIINKSTFVLVAKVTFKTSSSSTTCPPSDSPSYSYSFDSNNDGIPEKCYNPFELDNASDCKNQVGSMLPALTNISTSVCKTNPNTGAKCGYSRSDSGNSFQLDLEMNCFGDNQDTPEYDDEPMPEPDTCAKMNNQLMVCKSDPAEKCDFYGRCEKDCGYVNGQFYCFESCTGAECDEETPPVLDCVNNPLDPSCPPVEPEIPENCTQSGAGLLCKENPAEKCDEQGVCQPGCGEVNGVFVCYQSPSEESELFDVDLKPIVDELKALNKNFDFQTVKNRFSLDDLGSFGTIFGETDIEKLNSQIADKQSEIDDYIKDLKFEYSSMFELKGSGGVYEPITLDLSMGTFNVGFWDFIHNNSGVIAAVIMFLAYLTAARVVLE